MWPVFVISKTTLGTILNPVTLREKKHLKVELLAFLALNNKLQGEIQCLVLEYINSCVVCYLNSVGNTPIVLVPYANE